MKASRRCNCCCAVASKQLSDDGISSDDVVALMRLSDKGHHVVLEIGPTGRESVSILEFV